LFLVNQPRLTANEWANPYRLSRIVEKKVIVEQPSLSENNTVVNSQSISLGGVRSEIREKK
jgi:hypothetical protein